MAAKLADAVFGPVRLAGWEAVVEMRPGDKLTERRTDRLQDDFGCRVTGTAGSSGRAVKGQVGWNFVGLRTGEMANGKAGLMEACMSSEMRGGQGPLGGKIGLRAGLDARQPGRSIIGQGFRAKPGDAAERGS